MRAARYIALLAVAAVIATGATALAGSTPKHHVTIAGTAYKGWHFKPRTITIHKGQTVHWSWNSDAAHNVHFSKKRHSKTRMKISDFKLTFNKVGTFKYECTRHLFHGKVVVEP